MPLNDYKYHQSSLALWGQSAQIGTVHQKQVTFWNITQMMISNCLIEPFGVKYEWTNLGRACFYTNKESWSLFSWCHAVTFCCFLRIRTRKIIKCLLFWFHTRPIVAQNPKSPHLQKLDKYSKSYSQNTARVPFSKMKLILVRDSSVKWFFGNQIYH